MAPPAVPTRRQTPKSQPLASKPSFGTEFEYFLVENGFGYIGTHKIQIKDVGLVCVLGKNLQEGTEASSGAGKSRIWTLFLYLLFGKQALATEETIRDADLVGKDFRLETVFSRGGKRYLVRETRKHSNTRYAEGLHVYEISAANKLVPWNEGPKNDPKQLRTKLQQLLSWTYKEATGTVIWPQGFGHALIDGKPTERINFLSGLYGLTRFDEIYAALDAQHKEVKDKIAELQEFKGEYKLVEESVNKAGDVKQIVERARTLQTKLGEFSTTLEARRKKLRSVEHRSSRLHEIADQLERFQTFELTVQEQGLVATGTLLEDFDKSCAVVQQKFDKIKEGIDGIERLRVSSRRLQELGAADNLVALRARERELVDTLPTLKRSNYTESEFADLRKATMIMRDEVKALSTKTRVQPDESVIEAAYEAAMTATKEMAATLTMFSEQRDELEELRHKIVHRDGKCACPTCKQPIDDAKITQMVTMLTKRVDEIDRRLLPLESQEDALYSLKIKFADYKKLRNELVVVTESIKDAKQVNEIETELVTLRQKIQRTEKVRDLSKEVHDLRAKYGTLDATKYKRYFDQYRNLIAVNKEKRVLFYDVMAVASAVQASATSLHVEDPYSFDIASETKHISQEVERLRVWIEDGSKKLENGYEQLARFKQIVSDYKSKRDHLVQLKSKMDTLKALEDQEYVLSNTKPAYAKDGLKLQHLRVLLKQLSDRLPHWTKILFTDNTFVVKVKDDDGKSLSLVVPKTFEIGGKKVQRDIDISCLSGGEKSRLAVCLMLTMAELTARDKRANFLVLDEVDRHLDPYAQRLMAEILIPSLRRIKPSLYLISHSTFVDANKFDARMVVTKNKSNLSTITFTENTRRN